MKVAYSTVWYVPNSFNSGTNRAARKLVSSTRAGPWPWSKTYHFL